LRLLIKNVPAFTPTAVPTVFVPKPIGPLFVAAIVGTSGAFKYFFFLRNSQLIRERVHVNGNLRLPRSKQIEII
jgi:hypothetical protein